MKSIDRINSAWGALVGREQAATKTKTINITMSGYGAVKYFEEDPVRDRERVLKYQKIYATGGIVTACIDTKVEHMFANCINGVELKSESPGAADIIYDFIEKFDFVGVSQQLCKNSFVEGDGIAEIVNNKGKAPHDLISRDPYFFIADYDNAGVFMGYRQKKKDGSTGELIPPEKIWHMKLSPVVDSIFGRSLIGTAYDEIMRDAKTAEGIARGVERHGTPKYDIVVKTDGVAIDDDADFDNIAAEFKNINAKHEFIHYDDIELSMLDTSPIQAEEYSNQSLDRLCAAIRVPQELVGLGRGSTEATAKVRMKSFERDIKAKQAIFNANVNRQLFAKVQIANGYEPEPVTVDFGDIVDDNLVEKAEAIKNLMPQLDPFLVFHRDEIRDILKYVPYDNSPYAGDEDEEATVAQE